MHLGDFPLFQQRAARTTRIRSGFAVKELAALTTSPNHYFDGYLLLAGSAETQHDHGRHNPEIPATVHADNDLKRRPWRRRAEPLYFQQGRRAV